jgi:glycosyltransferase involved in cell wall biosynthesis
MNILFISDINLLNISSGAECVLHNQATELAKRDNKIYAITRTNEGKNSRKQKNRSAIQEATYYAPVDKLLQFLSAIWVQPHKLFGRLNPEQKFAVGLCHQPFTFVSLQIRGDLDRIPLVYVFHSPNHEEYLIMKRGPNVLIKHLVAALRRRVETWCLNRVDVVMVLSHYMKQKVKQIHNLADDRIIVNPGGFDAKRFKLCKDRTRTKRELKLPADKIHLLTVRNLEPRMGVDNLIKAVGILKEKNAKIHLVIGGVGPESKNLEALIMHMGLKNEVKMAGFIPAEQLSKYYGAADFFILPTRHLEGFGLVTVESMACGTPVLGTPIGGTKEILSNFNSQLLFQNTSPGAMAEGIESAIDNYFSVDNSYDQLRVKCREYALTNYSWQRHTNQLVSIINEILCNKDLTN